MKKAKRKRIQVPPKNKKKGEVDVPGEKIPAEVDDLTEEELKGVDMNNENLGLEKMEEEEKEKKRSSDKPVLNSSDSNKVTNKNDKVLNKR
jgi:hypothetical protein